MTEPTEGGRPIISLLSGVLTLILPPLYVVGFIAVLSVAQALGRTHLSAASPEVNSENFLVLALPMAMVMGVGLFFLLLDQIEFKFAPFRFLAVIGFACVACAPFLFTLLPPRSYPVAWPPYWTPRIQEVGGWFTKNELVMSDMPWALAWYGDRKCIWITLDAPTENSRRNAKDFFNIYDYQKPISGLYLTTLTSNDGIYAEADAVRSTKVAWGEFMLNCLIRGAVPRGCPLTHPIAKYAEEGQLWLADRPRWRSPSK